MNLSYRISSIKLDGIRGVNHETEIRLEEGLTVIHGSNGTGKSTVIQAIEWCLTGSIPYMKGGDFAREDALVNDFTELGRARVELLLRGPQEVRLSRVKKRMNNTSFKKYQLFLEADRTYQNDEAEAYLSQQLSLNFDEIQRGKFLHQETIRDILTFKPTERSAVIEKLLGTYDIKEFTKSLDQKEIKNQIKTIENTILSLQKDRIQFIANLRGSLDQLKKRLVEKGIDVNQLNQIWVLNEIEELRGALDSFTMDFNIDSVNHPEITSSIASLVEANNRLKDDTIIIDRKKMSKVNEKNSQVLILKNLLSTYSSALDHLKEYETLDLDELKEYNKVLEDKIIEIQNKINNIQLILTSLPSRKSVYKSAKDNLDIDTAKLSEIIKEYGEEQDVEMFKKILESDLVRINEDLKNYSGHQRIINLAIELLEETNSSECPVCTQEINTESLIKNLKSKISADIADKVRELTTTRNENNKRIEELTNVLQTLKWLRASLKTSQVNYFEAKRKLSELISEFDDDTDLIGLQNDLIQEVSALQQKLDELRSEYKFNDEKIRQSIFFSKEIVDTKIKLQLILGEKIEGYELLEIGKNFEKYFQEEMETLKDNHILDHLNSRTRKLADILDFLRESERTENAEKELPALNEQLNNLETRRASLQHLSSALNSIAGILTKYQKEVSIKQIQELENTMNEYYTAVLGHPYYKYLKIDVESEDPLQFSFKARREKESTYITTKFSAAQLNAAALSIFMSHSKMLAGQLPLLCLDDPTQSMDSEHKEAFARLIGNLLEEFQVIVATEDNETRDFLTKYCLKSRCYELGQPEIEALPDLNIITI